MNPFHITYKIARRITISIAGATVFLIGIIMIVTPGPAIVFIPIGLAILGLEFAWARTWLRRIRESISASNSQARGERAETHRRRHQRN